MVAAKHLHLLRCALNPLDHFRQYVHVQREMIELLPSFVQMVKCSRLTFLVAGGRGRCKRWSGVDVTGGRYPVVGVWWSVFSSRRSGDALLGVGGQLFGGRYFLGVGGQLFGGRYKCSNFIENMHISQFLA